MKLQVLGLSLALLFVTAAIAPAGSWSGWRGDAHNGVATSSPPLLRSLPAEGLLPVWESEPILSAGSGGWGSPVVAGGKVYLFTHTRKARSNQKLGPPKYPWLPDDKRGHLTPEQYQDYERKRREEDIERGKAFEYREILWCLDAVTGKTIWKNDHESVYTRFLQSGTPTIADGRVFILGAGLVARAIDAETGKDLWRTRLPGEFVDEFMMSSFAVADGVAAVLAGHLRGLDAATGKLRWEGDPKTTRGIHSSPVVWKAPFGQTFVANVNGQFTICVAANDGRELWRVKSEANLSTPVVEGDYLVTFGSSRRAGLRGFKMSESGAEELWKYQRVADKGSSPVVFEGHVYVQGERRVACVDLATGKEAWSDTLDLSTPQYTSLVAGDRKVFYACDGLLWFAADPSHYELLVQGKINKQGRLATEAAMRRMLELEKIEKQPDGLEKSLKIYQREVGNQGPLPCSSPALVDGKLYVRLRDRIACYDLEDPQGKLTNR